MSNSIELELDTAPEVYEYDEPVQLNEKHNTCAYEISDCEMMNCKNAAQDSRKLFYGDESSEAIQAQTLRESTFNRTAECCLDEQKETFSQRLANLKQQVDELLQEAMTKDDQIGERDCHQLNKKLDAFQIQERLNISELEQKLAFEPNKFGDMNKCEDELRQQLQKTQTENASLRSHILELEKNLSILEEKVGVLDEPINLTLNRLCSRVELLDSIDEIQVKKRIELLQQLRDQYEEYMKEKLNVESLDTEFCTDREFTHMLQKLYEKIPVINQWVKVLPLLYKRLKDTHRLHINAADTITQLSKFDQQTDQLLTETKAWEKTIRDCTARLEVLNTTEDTENSIAISKRLEELESAILQTY
ncbi:dynactin complex subunit [Schizosaccharomyces japonicus yFS275]|uniref:Dynactin complex subunit n=1 Tax=Schizosaccharomyces japonicus (strain yFS275 / FY16936) TaxID=402676 RepID=B6K4V9_SCHJY|nr:dynactin complex subunit [Schizosaccharomyces japonicus yFS275]EEB08516.1 dynactin complex subunit [Schizosaccharomyces japonicus yFS275]